jgi:hypothetical protein
MTKKRLITRRKFIISSAVILVSGSYIYRELQGLKNNTAISLFQEHYSFRCAYSVNNEILQHFKIDNQNGIFFNTLLVDKFFINSNEHSEILKKI